jgi:hypothetical protein
MARKRRHSPSPDDSVQGEAESVPTVKQPWLMQPRRADGRFVKIKKARFVKRTDRATIPPLINYQASATESTHPKQPEVTPDPSPARDINIPAEAHQPSSLHASESTIPRSQFPSVAVSDTSPSPLIPTTTNTSFTPSSSGEDRANQNHRTAAVAAWLQYVRTYGQEEQLVHSLNLPPPERLRHVAMYQRQYVRDPRLEELKTLRRLWWCVESMEMVGGALGDRMVYVNNDIDRYPGRQWESECKQ